MLDVKFLKIQTIINMLLPDNIHPENSIYYNGSLVLKELQVSNSQDIISLYEKVKANKEISFTVFVLCLDWLFLINTVEFNKKGVVKLCF